MPYVYYDELPEGMEAAEVVEQANYDALANELAGAISQRDEALDRLEKSQRETRDAKAKYASLVLDGGTTKQEPGEPPKDTPRGATIRSLFE